jgi:hypothetical protein
VSKLTKAQRRALTFLATVPHATAGTLGYAMDDGSYKDTLRAQGAGRIGGAMAWRLMRRELVARVDRGGGWMAYAITPAGRQALQQQEPGDG